MTSTSDGFLRWQIGDVRVTRVVESTAPLPADSFFPASTPEELAAHAAWLRPHFMDDDGMLILSIHALVVESQGRTIVVDTCVGNDKTLPMMGGLQTGFLTELARAGFDPATVDVVTCTHLHFDHVGWNTMRVDGRWVPTFPNARYLFHRVEYEHWSVTEAEYGGPAILAESVRPVVDAGLVDLVDTDHRLTDEVWLEPTPGHTPGHVSVRIGSRGAEAVITGDMTHHPVQFAEPGWGISADTDGAQAIRTRRDFVGRFGDSEVLVIGTHFNTPTAGHIVSTPEGTRFRT